VKMHVIPYLLPLCVVFLTACDPTASRSPADAVTFDTAKRLDDFDFAASGDGGLRTRRRRVDSLHDHIIC